MARRHRDDLFSPQTDGIGRPHVFSIKEGSMLTTLAIVLLVLWALGMVSSYTIGGFVHILLVVAVVMILVRIIQGRKPLG